MLNRGEDLRIAAHLSGRLATRRSHFTGNEREQAGQVCSEQGHGDNDRPCDQRRQKPILNRGNAAFGIGANPNAVGLDEVAHCGAPLAINLGDRGLLATAPIASPLEAPFDFDQIYQSFFIFFL